MSDKNVRGFENDIIRDRWRCPGIIETKIGDESSQNEWDWNFREIFRSHDPIKMIVLKDCLLLSSKCRLICLQQTSFVNNLSLLIQIQNFRFKQKNKSFLTIIKDIKVIFDFCLDSIVLKRQIINDNRILIEIEMTMISLGKYFFQIRIYKQKTKMINWILQWLFFKITTWKIFRKKFQRNFSSILRVLTLFVSFNSFFFCIKII